MPIAQNMLLLNVPFLVSVLCFLALVVMSLFRFEKMFRFTYYHTVLKAVLDGLRFLHLNAGWCNEVANGDYFFNFSVKHLMVIKTNALTLITIHYFKWFLTSFLSVSFYYTVMKFIMMLLSVPIYTFFETRVLFNDISLIIRHYFSYIFSIFVVYLLYHIRLIRLSSDIELNPGPKPSSFKCFSMCHWDLNSIYIP